MFYPNLPLGNIKTLSNQLLHNSDSHSTIFNSLSSFDRKWQSKKQKSIKTKLKIIQQALFRLKCIFSCKRRGQIIKKRPPLASSLHF